VGSLSKEASRDEALGLIREWMRERRVRSGRTDGRMAEDIRRAREKKREATQVATIGEVVEEGEEEE
jgi:hypothetical protein